MLLPGADGSASKGFRDGTHRVTDPAATVMRVSGLLPAFGITRVANVTGLDHVGVPVVVVCRPNARSLSVSQGKGATIMAARASGLMESIESWHAERIAQPLRLASWNELRSAGRTADCATLPQLSVSRFRTDLRILWIEGHDVAGGEPAWVPHELVHLDLTLPLPEGSGCFPLSSNGLASGNHLLEAAVHGVCEVIERDAYALWYVSSEPRRDAMRLDLSSVTDPGCRDLIDRFDHAGMLTGAWDITTDVRVPAFRCTIIDRETDPFRPLYPSSGLGCHPAREVALYRALIECAQSRLTRISSSRDDVPRSDYELTRNPDYLESIRAALRDVVARRRFEDAPTHDAPTLDDDLQWLVGRLADAGLSSVIIVDLTHPGIGIPVVRAVIPGLETKPAAAGWLPAERARRASVDGPSTGDTPS
jgi:ribosomal protein S12 methylthiotransferase accessory factor